MNKELLKQIAKKLTMKPKGILAIDESTGTCNKRFEKLGVPATEEKRREYREVLVTTPEIEDYISGYITFDETIRQSTSAGKKFIDVLKEKGIEVGIKVDTGTHDLEAFTGDKYTSGLEGLDARMKEYSTMGATFSKWRSVYTISEDTPSQEVMKLNAENFAEYALVCQENDIVPIVEPEVLFDGMPGTHSIKQCYEVTSRNLDIIFDIFREKGVYIPGVILKTGMVLAGKQSSEKSTKEEVAQMTLKCLREHVPEDIGGIVFLSGGQSSKDAVLNLNEIHKGGELPWPLTFSYGRAIQGEALKAWATEGDVLVAQKLLKEAARANSLASVGKYQ